MTLRQYLIFMGLGTALCWFAWVFVLWSVDPRDANWLSFGFFYLSLFLALVGTVSVGGFIFNRLFLKDDEIVFRHVKKMFRQSLIFAGLTVGVLFLMAYHLLRWWNTVLLVGLFIFLELFIFTKRKYSNAPYVQ